LQQKQLTYSRSQTQGRTCTNGNDIHLVQHMITAGTAHKSYCI